MSELSKQAQTQIDGATVDLRRAIEGHTAAYVGEPRPLPLVLAEIALGQATATLALVQATEAQTAAIARAGGRR